MNFCLHSQSPYHIASAIETQSHLAQAQLDEILAVSLKMDI